MKNASSTYSRFSGLALFSGFAGLAGIIALMVLSLTNEYRDANHHAQAEVGNISRMLDEHALATVHKADLLLREVQRNIRPGDVRLDRSVSGSRKQELHTLMKSQLESMPEVAVLHVTNAMGNHIYSSLDPVPRINIADRYHFTRHKDDAAAGLVMSPPIVSRTTGKWTIVLTRRLDFEDGSFAGIINVILNLEYLQQFYRSLDLDTHGLVALYDKEFRLAARYPPRVEDMGKKVPNHPVMPYIEKGEKYGVYQAQSPLDGIARTVSFRQVGDLPLIVIAGIAEDDYLAEWRRHIWQYSVGTIIFSLVVIGFGLRQRRAEEQLRAASVYARSLIEASLDPLVTISADGKIMDVNSATEKVTGQMRGSLIGSDFSNYFTEPEKARTGYQQVFSQGQVTDYPLAIRHASGKVTEVLYNASIYRDEKGEVAGVFAAARDITERKLAEQELKRSNAELEQFSYAISHDMRQPLRMISSYLQLLEKRLAGQLDGDKREFFDFAIDGAQRLDKMLLALLEYSRVGRKGEPPEWVESRALLDEALRFLQPAIAEAQAEVKITGDWPRVFVSRDEMMRLIQNLIGNAVKYRVAGRKPEI
ncbi:MAG: PAS domain S-box protein, partial [Betaproteobacteria bacterium]|nr:PAS domain S-box protein [Betaproteobacteria bacterium]